MAESEAMMIFAVGTPRNNRAAFTLIELILVMTMMIIAIGVVFPSMVGFARGRNLDNEARQFLSLTRYGQSRAISEGIPVELWINPRQETYGLQALSGYSESQTNPLVFAVDKTVQIAFSAPPTVLIRSNYWTQASGRAGALTKIRFQPDGFISDTSPENIFFREQGGAGEIWIAETPTHLRYEIQAGHPQGARR
jgi:type II secretion system protein H